MGLGLATAGGRKPHPFFFRGFVEHPDQVARGLLAVAEVARTRYFDAGASQRMRDPVVTSNRSVLRIEAFSACNGVYARLDIDDEGFESELIDWGTTNVDINEPLRAALSGVAAGDPLRLSVGSDELQVETLDGPVVERKVPLPDRWLKGFAEVQIVSAGMTVVSEMGVAAARATLRDLPRQRTGNQAMWVAFHSSGARLSRRATPDTPSLVGPQRLAALSRLLPFVRGLTVYAPSAVSQRTAAGRNNATMSLRPSAWTAHLASARFTLVISPELYRGFSGEGAVLDSLATADGHWTNAVAARLAGQARLDSESMATEIGSSPAEAVDALQVLGAAGRVGYDVHRDGFFHRDLPFDRSSLEAMQPRLVEARELVDGGAVAFGGGSAVVESGDRAYTVRSTPEGATCSCLWFAKHRGERGPCKHVLAVRLATAPVGDRP
ncbi:MAG: SWIM zinc finger family protein [Actinomycetia bacterium]|nr:SWIM zinc finger family protein [Actinomycetes bacterium]